MTKHRQLTDKARLFHTQWIVYWAMLEQTAPELIPEFKFVPDRGFRADWKIEGYPILIEVNGGIGMKKGAHKSWSGIHRDYHKARLAAANHYWFFPFSVYDLESAPVQHIRAVHDCMTLIDRER